MALINTGPNYTRTGDNFLTRWANYASFIPGVGAIVTPTLGVLGSLVEGAGWLFRGKVASAVTAVAAGSVSAVVNGAVAGNPLNPLYWGQLGSGLASGSSLGTHSRALTEGAIGMVTGALGFKPTVLQSYTAGVGSINAGPGQYARRVAAERGADPNAMYNQYRSGAGADHVAALEAARAQGPNQRAI